MKRLAIDRTSELSRSPEPILESRSVYNWTLKYNDPQN
jgi:hypothetical protein